MQLQLRVCPVCRHAIDVRDDLSGKRGCFGKLGEAHGRAERVPVVVHVDVKPAR